MTHRNDANDANDWLARYGPSDDQRSALGPDDPDPDAIVLKPVTTRRRLVALLIVIGICCAAGAALLGVLITDSNSSSAPPVTSSASAAPTVIPTAGATSTRSETVGGANELAVSGGGESTAEFTPASGEWTVAATTTCPTGATFVLDVIDPSGVRIGGWTTADSVQKLQPIHGGGTFQLRIGGGCGWTVSARG